MVKKVNGNQHIVKNGYSEHGTFHTNSRNGKQDIAKNGYSEDGTFHTTSRPRNFNNLTEAVFIMTLLPRN